MLTWCTQVTQGCSLFQSQQLISNLHSTCRLNAPLPCNLMGPRFQGLGCGHLGAFPLLPHLLPRPTTVCQALSHTVTLFLPPNDSGKSGTSHSSLRKRPCQRRATYDCQGQRHFCLCHKKRFKSRLDDCISINMSITRVDYIPLFNF